MTEHYSAICAALQELGIRSHHFSEVSKNKQNRHIELWLSAVQIKYDGKKGKPWKTSQDFDRVLWNYDVSRLPVPVQPSHRTVTEPDLSTRQSPTAFAVSSQKN